MTIKNNLLFLVHIREISKVKRNLQELVAGLVAGLATVPVGTPAITNV